MLKPGQQELGGPAAATGGRAHHHHRQQQSQRSHRRSTLHNNRASMAQHAACTSSDNESDSSGVLAEAGWRPPVGTYYTQPASGSSQRQRDKEWAALTTWIRMNLHHVSLRLVERCFFCAGRGGGAVGAEQRVSSPSSLVYQAVQCCSAQLTSPHPPPTLDAPAPNPQPRTAKKRVLFVGTQDAETGAWSFELNAGLTWEDVSPETKLRLRTLPEETVRFALA